MQNPVVDLLMNMHGQSSLLEYPLFRRNSFNRLCHIRTDYFKSYKDLASFTQYMLQFVCTFKTRISSGTFMNISESSDSYKYAVMTSINCKDRWFCIARDIKYRKVMLFVTGEYVSLKSISGLYVNPCATNLALYLTTSLFLFHFWMNTHLNPTGKIIGEKHELTIVVLRSYTSPELV
jgi:hypothetical protein